MANLVFAVAPLRTIGEPRREKVAPRSGYHAKSSWSDTVAAALLGGGGLGVYLDDFTDEAVTGPTGRALAERITAVADEICDPEFPHAFSAVLRVRTLDGRRWEHRNHSSRGGAQHLLTEAELAAKFTLNATRVLRPDAAADLATAVAALPERTQVGPLVAP